MLGEYIHMHVKTFIASQTRQTKMSQTRRYSRQTENACYTLAGFVDSVDFTGKLVEGNWRKLLYNNLQPIRPVRNSGCASTAIETREKLTDY